MALGARAFALGIGVSLCGLFPPAASAPAGIETVYSVLPSQADPAVAQFNDPNVVIIGKNVTEGAQLAVFLPGTGGRPMNVMPLLRVIAGQGYRVIGLEYDDEPAVVQVCPRDPDLACSADFREERVFGGKDGAAVQNPPQETIVQRLVALLRYLDRQYPSDKWKQYLAGDEPDWSKIVVSGLSQGAGMAAYIAKRRAVARAVLFSSPWDFSGRARQLAPWLAWPSATPPERWFAEYHRREKTADLIAQAYGVLRIPPDHVQVFDLDLPDGMGGGSGNPYHGSTVHMEGYIPQWQILYGHSP
ncbi:MAG: hypothetical protein JO348_10800 [Alphaproteobacteria bacterium]|nr:hypothetical protein [Alphaproteobacteria bacterium]